MGNICTNNSQLKYPHTQTKQSKGHVGMNNEDELNYNSDGEGDILEEVERQVAKNPTNGTMRDNFGKLLFKEGKRSEALKHLKKAVMLGSADFHTMEIMGKGLIGDAIQYWRDAIELNPHFGEGFIKLAELYSQLKDFDNALYFLSGALKIDNTNPYVYNDFGLCYMNKGYPDIAIGHFCKAIELYPNFSKAFNNLGNAHIKIGRIDEAIASYKKAIEYSFETFHIAHLNLGGAFIEKGDIYCALINLEISIRNNQNEEIKKNFKRKGYDIMFEDDCIVEAILDFYKARNYRKVIGLLDKIYSLNPKNIVINFYLGRSFHLIDLCDQALVYYEIILKELHGVKLKNKPLLAYFYEFTENAIKLIRNENANFESVLIKEFSSPTQKTSNFQKLNTYTTTHNKYFKENLPSDKNNTNISYTRKSSVPATTERKVFNPMKSLNSSPSNNSLFKERPSLNYNKTISQEEDKIQKIDISIARRQSLELPNLKDIMSSELEVDEEMFAMLEKKILENYKDLEKK